MSTFIEKYCLYPKNSVLKDKKSKTIEILKFRQCMNSCCAKVMTLQFGESLIQNGFATTYKENCCNSGIKLENQNEPGMPYNGPVMNTEGEGIQDIPK